MATDIQFLCEHVMLGILRRERVGKKLIFPFRKTAAETPAGASFGLGSTEERGRKRGRPLTRSVPVLLGMSQTLPLGGPSLTLMHAQPLVAASD
jgi:hypothetical protein